MTQRPHRTVFHQLIAILAWPLALTPSAATEDNLMRNKCAIFRVIFYEIATFIAIPRSSGVVEKVNVCNFLSSFWQFFSVYLLWMLAPCKANAHSFFRWKKKNYKNKKIK